eukprot:GHVU01054704.1.p2 GENE.GHVU01054704.1~~GHVU01054704.1.p2  ORF type:complete len:134 (-),score=13.70 GHVU01054704.1:440-841(-)
MYTRTRPSPLKAAHTVCHTHAERHMHTHTHTHTRRRRPTHTQKGTRDRVAPCGGIRSSGIPGRCGAPYQLFAAVAPVERGEYRTRRSTAITVATDAATAAATTNSFVDHFPDAAGFGTKWSSHFFPKSAAEGN